MIPFIVGLALHAPAQAVKPTAGLMITKSCKVAKGDYLLPSGEALDTPAITIRGDGITVDFAGAVIRGTPQTTWPDKREGLGLLVAGKNVTIKNAVVRGYKVGLMARNCPGLRILNSDFSHNWGVRLLSTTEAEDGADWQSYHFNPNDEWLRYGAAIYLRGCDGFEVQGSRATGGQCGLMMTDCTKGLVWNCDFSFLSGVGIGLWRSSDNRIMHNKVDWCVRGFSYGVYNRGQDSAGILIFEQSSRNVFAYNSVTHGGDGFFLWAGQTTMDTGRGGCNDNLLYGNDFSHSPCNAIESTFSRNRFIDNLLVENWHGVWGGYSYDNDILGNVCAYNGESMAIEHGPRNRMAYNLFDRDDTGVDCWGGAGGWGTSLGLDTSSRDATIDSNLFVDITHNALELSDARNFNVRGNTFERNGRVLKAGVQEGLVFSGNRVFGPKESWDASAGDPSRGNTWKTTGRRAGPPPTPAMAKSGCDLTDMAPAFRDDLKRFYLPWNPWPGKPLLCPLVRAVLPEKVADEAEAELNKAAPEPLAGGMNPFIRKGTLRGRRYILMGEWGPYNFRRPLLYPRETVLDARTGESVRTYEVLGPKGSWRMLSRPEGLSVSAENGRVPGSFTARFPANGVVAADFSLEYAGKETVDERGQVTAAGKPVKFGLHAFHAAILWHVAYHPFDRDTEDPLLQPEAFAQAMKRSPVFEETTADLNWAGRPNDEVGPEYYGDVAIGAFTIPQGDYVVKITSDDGVRAWLDGKPILTNGWVHQIPTTYDVPVHLGGKHTLRVEHFQQDGFATLRVRIVPADGE